MTCFFNWNFIQIMRMILKTNLSSINRNSINLMKIMISNLCYFTKLIFTKFDVEIFVFVIIDVFVVFDEFWILFWKFNYRLLMILNCKMFKINNDNLTILKCKSIIYSNCLIRLRIFLKNFRIRFCSKIFNFFVRR